MGAPDKAAKANFPWYAIVAVQSDPSRLDFTISRIDSLLPAIAILSGCSMRFWASPNFAPPADWKSPPCQPINIEAGNN